MASGVDFSFHVFVIGHNEAGGTDVCGKFAGRPVAENFFGTSQFEKTIEVDDMNIALRIWDESNWTEFSDLFFFQDQGLMLVYDVTKKETFECLERLYPKWRKYKSPLATMLVGNNCHKEKRRVVAKERGAKLAAEHGFHFLEINAAKNINVHEAFYTLARQLKIRLEEKRERIRRHAASTASQWVVKRPNKAALPTSDPSKTKEEQQLEESGWKINELPDKVIYELGTHFKILKNWEQLPELIGFSADFLEHLKGFRGQTTERVLIQWGKSEPDATVFELYAILNHLGEHIAARVLLDADMQATTAPPEILARGHLAVEAYRNALREGSAHLRRVPIMLMGQERSGKTSLKKSLMGQSFNPDEESTVGIDKGPSYFEVTTEIWKPGEKAEAENADTAVSFEHHAARLIVSNLRKEGKEKQLEARTSGSTAQPYVRSGETDPDPDSHSHWSPDARFPPLEVFSDVPSKEKSSPGDEANVPDDVAALVEKFLRDANKEKEEQDEIFSVLWDFGGQSVYYVTHPLFLTPRAMYVLVHNLSRNPHHQDHPPMKHGVFQTYEDRFQLKTSLDYLDFWMTSVASLASQDEAHPANTNNQSHEFPGKLPPVFLVCTHADQPYEGRNARELALKMYGFLQSKPYKSLLYDDVFVVDNTKSGRESECSEVIRLRKKVLEVAKDLPQMKEVIPIKWLRYEKSLQAIKEGGRKWIPLDKAKEIATEECQIVDHQEFVTLLNFLHDLKTLIHFDDTPELNNLVVLDLQWLVDVFKKVITIKPYDYEERKVKELWSRLESTGILEEALLQHVWGPLLNQQETSDSLIQIMAKFSLLSPWPSSEDSSSKQYLVPSMLMSPPPQQVIDFVDSAPIPSLFLKCRHCHIPPSFFPRLVLQFFKWCAEEFPSQVTPQLFHNFARFYICSGKGCSVVLLCHLSSVEVIFLAENRDFIGPESLRSDVDFSEQFSHDTFEVISAGVVRNQLALMIDSMRNEFCWLRNMSCEVSFLCPVCSRGGAVDFCRKHRSPGCKQEECLHFFSESELLRSKRVITCTRSATALDNTVQIKQFTPWFTPKYDKNPEASSGYDQRLYQQDPQASSAHEHTLYQQDPQASSAHEHRLYKQDPQASGGLDCRLYHQHPQASSAHNRGLYQQEPQASSALDRRLYQQDPQAMSALDRRLCQQDPQTSSSHDRSLVFSAQSMAIHHPQHNALALPCDVLQTLYSPCDPQDVVVQFQKHLQLNQCSLMNPDHQTTRWIRCLAKEAKRSDRRDVVKHLREITSAGTTGPLLDDDLHVQRIPLRDRTELAVSLCGGEEWKQVVERLGFSDAYIRCFDHRFRNPVEAALRCCNMSVGEFYDLLVECGFPVLADIL